MANVHEAGDLTLVSDAGGRRIDRRAAQLAAADLLRALGADLGSPGLRDTPRRMAQAYAELLTPEPFLPTTSPNEAGYDQLVMVRAIPFHSLCMHHALPFHGIARDLQVQEALTTQIAGWVQEELQPAGVGVVLEAEHLCMSLRGVQKAGARTVTSSLHGLIREDPRTRQEFFALTKET